MSNDFTPHRVNLVGHRDLGQVQARWLGCILELEDGTRYGPSALFEVKPVREEPKAEHSGPVLDRWDNDGSQWSLRRPGLGTGVRALAMVSEDGWTVFRPDGGTVQGYRGGLAGREFAREWWLERGATDAPGSNFSLHDTRAIASLDVGGKVVLLDGTTKTVVAGTASGRMLFSDGSWMTLDALCDAVDSIVCLADQDIPF